MRPIITIFSDEFMPQSAMHIISMLCEADGQAMVSGGYVRDLILENCAYIQCIQDNNSQDATSFSLHCYNIPKSDIDIATTLLPEQVIIALKKHNIKTVPTGLKYGTVTAIIDNETFEITTLRKDVLCDGRHADVEFHDNWKVDAERRDFTINAMYLSASGEIYDFFSGLQDLVDGVVRFIGSPIDRIQEDNLRILRFFRFASRFGIVKSQQSSTFNRPLSKFASDREVIGAYGAEDRSVHVVYEDLSTGATPQFSPEVEFRKRSNIELHIDSMNSLDAAISMAPCLLNLSRERIGGEMMKMLSSSRCGIALKIMQKHDILQYVGICKYNNAILHNRKFYNDAKVNLCALVKILQYTPSDVDGLTYAWCIGKKLSTVLANQHFLTMDSYKLFANFNSSNNGCNQKFIDDQKLFIDDMGRDVYILCVKAIDVMNDTNICCDHDIFASLVSFAYNWTVPKFPLTGNDIIALGIYKQDVGMILRTMRNVWRRSRFSITKEKMIKIIRALMITMRQSTL